MPLVQIIHAHFFVLVKKVFTWRNVFHPQISMQIVGHMNMNFSDIHRYVRRIFHVNCSTFISHGEIEANIETFWCTLVTFTATFIFFPSIFKSLIFSMFYYISTNSIQNVSVNVCGNYIPFRNLSVCICYLIRSFNIF